MAETYIHIVFYSPMSCRNFPVALASHWAMSCGVPWATMRPPAAPPSVMDLCDISETRKEVLCHFFCLRIGKSFAVAISGTAKHKPVHAQTCSNAANVRQVREHLLLDVWRGEDIEPLRAKEERLKTCQRKVSLLPDFAHSSNVRVRCSLRIGEILSRCNVYMVDIKGSQYPGSFCVVCRVPGNI